jgi:hypothetical protein
LLKNLIQIYSKFVKNRAKFVGFGQKQTRSSLLFNGLLVYYKIIFLVSFLMFSIIVLYLNNIFAADWYMGTKSRSFFYSLDGVTNTLYVDNIKIPGQAPDNKSCGEGSITT